MPQKSSSEITGPKPNLDLPLLGLQGCPPELSAPGLTQFTLKLFASTITSHRAIFSLKSSEERETQLSLTSKFFSLHSE